MELTEESASRTARLQTDEKNMVCRRVVRQGVVVATWHPIAGPLYWRFVDESECNAPDGYDITDDIDFATVFMSGMYRGKSFLSFKEYCLRDISKTLEIWNEELEEYGYVEDYCWRLEKMAEKAGCSTDEFADWLRKAIWVEYPAPMKIYFLRDFNGLMGYRAEWSDDVRDALRWSCEELAAQDDLDVELAGSYGHFVLLSEALVVRPVANSHPKVNHALEADYALTLVRLGLSKSRDWSRAESGVASWLGDMKETAWVHAARAGIEHFRDGEVLPVSDHIAAFPELLDRFNMAVALARYDAMSISRELTPCSQKK